jgi:hypothetical protein
MAFIESAFYGDEKSQRNATKVLGDKITGTSLKLDVNEQLIPPFEVAEKVEITSLEEKKIKQQAVKQCGGVDQECVRTTEALLRQNTLTEKQTQANSSATAIKGRRLTVNIIDENGQRRRLVVPDGQKFSLDNVSVTNPTKGVFQAPSSAHIQSQMMILAGLVVSTLVYVFSVAATYTLFMQNTEMWVALPVTAISVFLPYSGYIMIFLYFMGKSAINTFIAKQQG